MYIIEKYDAFHKREWDKFVLDRSFNGTFLQSKNFLDYHPAERFEDASLLIYDSKKKQLAAVIPACYGYDDTGRRWFCSHKGSTFGGIVLSPKYYRAAYIQELLAELENFLLQEKCTGIWLKVTPILFCSENPALLEYMLTLNRYQQYTELNCYIDFEVCESDLLKNLNATKRKKIHRAQRADLEFHRLFTRDEIRGFYCLLEKNLKKYQAKPIHSLPEIFMLNEEILKDDLKFYGVFEGKELLAAGMIFEFRKQKIAHTQNLATDPEREETNAISFLYYSLMEYYKKQGNMKYLSWGISTENHGRDLNFDLLHNKESYGSKYYLNRSFYKYF